MKFVKYAAISITVLVLLVEIMVICALGVFGDTDTLSW